VTVHLRDAASSTRRGKPTGVVGATIFTAVGDQPPALPANWQYHTYTTRATLRLDFNADVPNGAKVWICARWYNPRQEPGPTSAPAYTHLGFAIVSNAA
jgi:hypothetical protein